MSEQREAFFGFNGPIESSSVTRICAALNAAVNNGYNRINLTFSSLGGYTADGIYLYNHLRALPIPVCMHATGNIASIAIAIFAGAEVRYCSRHVLFMMHPTAVPGSAEGMAWDRLNSLMSAALAEDNRTDGILSERYAIPTELMTARRLREVHFTAQQAVEFGIAHEVKEFALPAGCEVIQI